MGITAVAAPVATADAGRGRFWRSVLLFWAASSAIVLVVSLNAVVAWRFPDPDDQMRLLQVRDWLAGQSWFDVTQHRLNLPWGVAMHWSRLVDLPIASVILLTKPLFGAAGAELAALIIVPLVTYGAVLAALSVLARRVLDEKEALLTVCLAPLCVDVTNQLRPMRIDHHGWQMALALVAAAALTGRTSARTGLIAGSAVALWLSVSLEGLPLAAAMLALAALRWAVDSAERAFARAVTISACVVAIVLFAATHPATAWSASACDAVSPVYLAMLGATALGTMAVTALPLRTVLARLAGLTAVGAAALALVPLLAPACAAGPFDQLDPLVRQAWYLRVMEGLPLWMQTPPVMVGTVGVPLVGLAGAVLATRDALGTRRQRWAALLFLMACATVQAIFVQRSAGLANLLALLGVVRVVHPLLLRARIMPSFIKRLAATAGAFLPATPGLAADMASQALAPDARAVAMRRAQACTDANEMRAMARLPRGDVLAPLDISPAILLLTPHGAVASGHHRGAAAMRDVIAAFTGSEASARTIITRRRVEYVAFCPGLAEVLDYENQAPGGFLARLDHGVVPRWLAPVTITGSPVRVWRVR